MFRRASASFRNRESIAVVNETRGSSYEYINFALAIPFFYTGLRNLFFCNYAASWEGEEIRIILDNVWPDCKENKHQEMLAGIAGCLGILVGCMRLFAAKATHVADFYFATSWLSLCDVMLLFIMFRMGFENFGTYNILVASFACYEAYIGLIARKAHVARLKMKKQLEEINSLSYDEDEDEKKK